MTGYLEVMLEEIGGNEMQISEIKKRVRAIELAYDYDHSVEDYTVTVNLTALAELIDSMCSEARKEPSVTEFIKWLSTQMYDVSTDRTELLVVRDSKWAPAVDVFLEETR